MSILIEEVDRKEKSDSELPIESDTDSDPDWVTGQSLEFFPPFDMSPGHRLSDQNFPTLATPADSQTPSQSLLHNPPQYAVSRWGYYLPWSIASGILGTVATGLISTFGVDTSTGQWIGYQILFGVGCRIGIQMPILAAQNSLPDSDIPMAISLLIFYQNIVSSIWLSVASTIFKGSLQTYIPQLAPSVDPTVIIHAGARGIRDVVSQGPVLTQVLIAYSMSIDNAFHLAAASFGTGLFFAWGMGWKDIRKNKVVNTNEMVA
ncbi:hypothetical protein GGR58DRAFT_499933 [Xylaria digitata]|nr:hypothetical protein GGR58DRAFT_499933 [Xylaria digitata]